MNPFVVGALALLCGLLAIAPASVLARVPPPRVGTEGERLLAETLELQRLARATTVRIMGANVSGSGAIARRQGQLYSVFTCWHVVAFSDSSFTLLAPDGKRYSLASAPRQVGNTDLAVVQFRSRENYQVAAIASEPPIVGEPVVAAGFPMYRRGTTDTTFDIGIQAFRLTQGQISLLPPKGFPQGYRLGYSNDIEIGMSGGPIFNGRGYLIGVNGRIKNRDPGFGTYTFEDGTEPPPEMLERAIASSWGIPLSPYRSSIGGN